MYLSDKELKYLDMVEPMCLEEDNEIDEIMEEAMSNADDDILELYYNRTGTSVYEATMEVLEALKKCGYTKTLISSQNYTFVEAEAFKEFAAKYARDTLAAFRKAIEEGTFEDNSEYEDDEV